METSGIGGTVYELRKKIQELQTELTQLGDPTAEIPELVSSANALRSCEFLQKQNDKQNELFDKFMPNTQNHLTIFCLPFLRFKMILRKLFENKL